MKLNGSFVWSTVGLLFVVACSDDAGSSSPDGGDDLQAGDAATETGDVSADASDDSSVTADAVEGDAAGIDVGSDLSRIDPYLEGCDSLFAARILQLELDENGEPWGDCSVPLTREITLANASVSCQAGESPNTCRQRLYEHPPPTDQLTPDCWNETRPEGCLRAHWIPRCADGSDECAEDEVVCVDGSRPMAWAEAATRGASNRWIIFMGGEGAPCTGHNCWVDYRYGQLHNPATPRAMSTLHPDHRIASSQTGGGILNGMDLPQNPFAAYNRVHFDRCGDAASTAREVVPVFNGVPAELADAYPDLPVGTRASTLPVYHYGLDTWRGLFHSLATSAGRDLDGDNVPDLPDLSEAELVLLVGGSDASIGLVFAADALAGELRGIAGDDVDVRILMDGFFEPTLDNEGRYHPEAPDDFNLFRYPYDVTGLCALPEGVDSAGGRTCSDTNYRPGGPGGSFRVRLDIRGVVRDASCEAEHGVGSAPCADKLHTLFQHVAAPFLVLADQEDRTIVKVEPPYADDGSYRWTRAAYRRRVLDQAHDVTRHWSTNAREEGPGDAGMAALILHKARRDGRPPSDARHVRAGSNEGMELQMTRCSADLEELASATLAELVDAWLSGPVPAAAIIEDADAWDGSSPFWVTGEGCREPE